jgi:ABC-type dipeptide/oligopeptide/nickel transport system permease component
MMWTIPTMFVITFLVFIAIRIGTDPVQSYLRINPRASQAKIQQYKEVNGLTGNIAQQYFPGSTTSSRSTGASPSRAAVRCGPN